MKKFLWCLLLLVPMVGAETLSLDWKQGATQWVPRTEKTVKPEAGEPGLRFEWDTRKGAYIEMGFHKPLDLPPFSQAVVKATFHAPVGCSARQINVRFRDKDGEITQFRQDVSFVRGGDFEVVWPIDPHVLGGSWGCEKLNRKIDMPAKLHAMTISYSTWAVTGHVHLTGLTVETVPVSAEPMKILASRPICTMDDASQFTKHWGQGDFECRDGRLYFENTTSRMEISERKFAIQRFEPNPCRLTFDTELFEGNASLVAVFVYADKIRREADGRAFESKPVAIPSGRGKTVLDTTELLKDAAFPVRLARFDVIPADKTSVTLQIHGIDVVQKQTAAEAVDFEVRTDTRIHVLSVGKEDSLKFQFTNRATTAGNFQFAMEYENFAGKKQTERLEKTLAAGEVWEVSPQWRPDSLGHWNLTANISEKATKVAPAVKKRSLAWIRPAGPTVGRASGFLFSVCTHTERWSKRDRALEVEVASLCGVKVVRLGAGWVTVEPKRGDWNWTMLDELVAAYAEQGVEPQVICGSTPAWTAKPEVLADKTRMTWKNYPANLDDWREYTRQLATRYKGKIRFYENWNEPDLRGFSEMNVDEYSSLQRAAFEEITRADSQAVVLSGGFATLSNHPGLITPTFQEDFLNRAKGAFHVHAIHEHGWFDGYRKRIDTLFLPLREKTGTQVPWYSNETAMTSIGGQEKRQAECLFKKLLFAWIRGSIGYTWYDLRNDGYDPQYGEHHFGMVTNDFYPKEVYSTYNMLATYFRNARAMRDISPDPEACIYLFGEGETNLLIPAWIESPFQQTRYFLVKTDAKSAKFIDLMGNETPVEVHDSRLVYPVTPEPRTLKLENATSSVVVELVHAKDVADLVPGRSSKLTLSLGNPLNQDVVYTLTLLSEVSGLKFSTSPQTVKIAASGVASATLEITADESFRQPAMLPLLFGLEGTEISGIVFVPLHPAFFLSAAFPETPDYVLDSREQVTSLTPADPSNAHRLWQGPDDLRANVWLAGTADVFRMRAEVFDDTTKQDDKNTADVGDQMRLFFQTDDGRFSEIPLTPCDSGEMLRISHEGNRTLYEAEIPWQRLGISTQILRDFGVRITFAIGDDDGDGMDTWIHPVRERPESKTMKQAFRYLLHP